MKTAEGHNRSFFLISAIAVLIFSVLALLSLNTIKNRSYSTQIVLIAPKAVFSYWSWPFSGWRLHKVNLTLTKQPDSVLKGLDGQIVPRLWNLLMGCSSGLDLNLDGMTLTLPGANELVSGLRTLFAELSFNRNNFHKYVCQSTHLSAVNSKLNFEQWGGLEILIKKFSTQKTDSPVVQWDGVFPDRKPFGVTLTYKPGEDIAVFTSDFWQQAHFDGQVESFSSPQNSFLSGKVHCPAATMTFGNPNSESFSITGIFSVSSDLSGHLSDLVTRFWAAETLMFDGAVDVREGVLKPFNLSADVLRDVGQIPALTQLGRLRDEKALPKPFYFQETPFELLRFVIQKDSRLIELSRIVIKHSAYLAAGDGSINPETGTILFKGSLVLSDDLSRRLIKNVPALEILSSADGRLAFPFKIEGNLQAPKVHADIKKLTETMIAAYRTELVRRGNSRVEIVQ